MTAGVEELGEGVEERKTWNKRTKRNASAPSGTRLGTNTLQAQVFHTLRTRPGLSSLFPKHHLFFLSSVFPYGKKVGLEDKGEQKTLQASPVLVSSNYELCVLIGLISMNNVLVFSLCPN